MLISFFSVSPINFHDCLCLNYLVLVPILYVNLLETCGTMKCLQSLNMIHINRKIKLTTIPFVMFHNLSSIKVSILKLQLFVLGCQKLESLSLKCIKFSNVKLKLNHGSFNTLSNMYRKMNTLPHNVLIQMTQGSIFLMYICVWFCVA
jgi:hypothetical protein